MNTDWADFPSGLPGEASILDVDGKMGEPMRLRSTSRIIGCTHCQALLELWNAVAGVELTCPACDARILLTAETLARPKLLARATPVVTAATTAPSVPKPDFGARRPHRPSARIRPALRLGSGVARRHAHEN
jgi:hypothetical protein